MLRYNPDNFRTDGRNIIVAPKERQRRLVEVVRAWLLQDPAPGKQLARFFMYYDGRSDSRLPVVAKEWDSEEARAVSAVFFFCFLHVSAPPRRGATHVKSGGDFKR